VQQLMKTQNRSDGNWGNLSVLLRHNLLSGLL